MKYRIRPKDLKVRIGLRTLKTTVAVVLSMLVVETYGTTSSRLIFAMLGAMAAVQPTFKESVTSCLTQIVGVLFGGLAGVFLLMLPVSPLLAAGIGLVLVITLYNSIPMRFSPSLPCFMVFLICTTSDIKPMTYAVGRCWDTAIGLAIGLVINTLVCPYDNSRKIRSTVESLDRELIDFLTDLFDGDNHLPDADRMSASIDNLAGQLRIFENQLLPLRLRKQHEQLETFHLCQGKARQLVAQMEVLCRIGQPGRLTPENHALLVRCGAKIHAPGDYGEPTEKDIVTNYHVTQLLILRQDLLDALQ